MHNLDHHGVSYIVGGSVIADVVRRHQAFGNTKQHRMDQINFLKDEWYSNHIVSSRMPDLGLKNIQWGGQEAWAELHGPLVKAANTRH